MIKTFLESKYGKYVTDRLISADGKVIIENIDKDGLEQQEQVISHITGLRDKEGKKLIPDNFLINKVEWGVDFSSWLGSWGTKKKYMFIGAEPHIGNNYQLVYDFGCFNDKSIEESAKIHYGRESDIWYYLTRIFVDDLTNSNITDFLSKCYITDLSHMVPKQCGQVKDISKKLNITEKEWSVFRSKVAQTFIPDEIKAVNPEYVILHGNASRNYFRDVLNLKYTESYSITDSPYKILVGQFNGYKVVSIPHLKGDMRNKLWKCKKYPGRPISAKSILTQIIN